MQGNFVKGGDRQSRELIGSIRLSELEEKFAEEQIDGRDKEEDERHVYESRHSGSKSRERSSSSSSEDDQHGDAKPIWRGNSFKDRKGSDFNSRQTIHNINISEPALISKTQNTNPQKLKTLSESENSNVLKVLVIPIESDREPYEMEVSKGNNLKHIFSDYYWSRLFKGYSPEDPCSFGLFKKPLNEDCK